MNVKPTASRRLVSFAGIVLAGSVRARTTSGSIKLKTVKSSVVANNAGGDIHIEAAGETVKAETTSGSIDVGLVAPPSEACRLEVAGGSIKLKASRAAAVPVEVVVALFGLLLGALLALANEAGQAVVVLPLVGLLCVRQIE